jgi:hypothetical protein
MGEEKNRETAKRNATKMEEISMSKLAECSWGVEMTSQNGNHTQRRE